MMTVTQTRFHLEIWGIVRLVMVNLQDMNVLEVGKQKGKNCRIKKILKQRKAE